MDLKLKLASIGIILSLGFIFVPKTQAASLNNVSDTLTTSRPSAAAPLATDQAANAGSVTVVDLPTSLNNSALWIASDSAVLLPDTGQSISTARVASMSASNTPSSNQRVVYFTGQVANAHHQGTTMITPITATHTIQFTTNTAIPGGGHIVIQFPGAGSNIASPSATGFSFNGMSTSNPSDVVFNNATCASVAVTNSNTIDCTLNGAGVSGSVTVTAIIGCTTQSGGVCTVFAPRLINPIKSAQAAGSADQWTINLYTQDSGGVTLDNANLVTGIIESVQVQGTVEPFITFSITGVANGTSVCGDSTGTNTGIASTSTFVNMGSLNSGGINRSAQTMVINTNANSGYSLTATSSGRFINPSSGFYLLDANGGNGLTGNSASNGTAPAPTSLVAGTPEFGIHPCAAGSTSIPTVPAGWGTGGDASNLYANPWNTGTNGYYALLASYNAPASASTTTVVYGATVASTTPPGTYSTVFTYVATAIF